MRKQNELIKKEMKKVRGGFKPLVEVSVTENDATKGLENAIVGCHSGQGHLGVFVSNSACPCDKKKDNTSTK